jgi:hypothetical protein
MVDTWNGRRPDSDGTSLETDESGGPVKRRDYLG